ncbi:unnamed protein product [Rotaria sordida]|uniref:Uncharacterized protein n=1 Tax=Rotaria sordida TaxID=392033 RepID=A0A814HPZ0_9BILA|nr:unnamed protein product [Rotaria sordida]CAF3691589.1 unnamed protein product [Rotaria sordida]CAF3811474.1 unnamed protein product [Rotaria sordida]
MATNTGATLDMVAGYNENRSSQLAVVNYMIPYIHLDNSYQGVSSGRSFNEQCLPSNSLSIGFSSSLINWLSKVHCTITNHLFYTFANEKERETFKHQSKLDFDAFIENRSRELVPGGILILNIPSTNHQGIVWTVLYCDHVYTCAKLLFNEQELSDLTIPVYFRSLSECIDYALFDRCSLQLIKAELAQMNLPFSEKLQKEQLTFNEFIKIMTKTIQCALEGSVRQPLEINERSKEEIDQLLIEL